VIAIHRRRIARPLSAALALTAASVIAAGCGGSSSSGGSTPQGSGIAGQSVPTAGLPVLKTIGKGEGQLNLIAWEGYLNPIWVKPFEQQTGCQINAKYAGSSDEMVALM
jgi:putative spermidine/putrescine transport system substrate-binding protein